MVLKNRAAGMVINTTPTALLVDWVMKLIFHDRVYQNLWIYTKPQDLWLNSDRELIYLSTVS